MSDYSLEIVNKHIFAKINDLDVLIDTGSPVSIGRVDSIIINGEEFELTEKFLNADVETISGFIGENVDVLLGGNILKNFKFYIDVDNKKIKFSKEPLNLDGEKVRIDVHGNLYLTMKIKINDNDVVVFVDTGAALSYLNPDITNHFEIKGREKDFYPGLGEFTTDIYEIPIIICNTELKILAGNLPSELQTMIDLFISDVKGILGYDLFRFFNIAFDYENKELTFVKRK